MPSILLLRHGQASFGAADYDQLSDLGREQAAVAGEALRRRGLREPLWVSGTLRRQQDTAAIAMQAAGVATDVMVDRGFNEYDHVGMVTEHAAATGVATPDHPGAFQEILDVALAQWVKADADPGWRAFSSDAIAGLETVVTALRPGQDAVIATSGGVIAAICASLLLGDGGTVVALNRVTVNAGLTTILAGRRGLSLLTFNDHAHLSGADGRLRTYR